MNGHDNLTTDPPPIAIFSLQMLRQGSNCLGSRAMNVKMQIHSFVVEADIALTMIP